MDKLLSDLQAIKDRFRSEIKTVDQEQKLDALRVKLLGKKGELTAIMKNMGRLSNDDRRRLGQAANEIRQIVEKLIDEKQTEMSHRAQQEKIAAETIDISLPGKRHRVGGRHPLALMSDEICEIFLGLGYSIAEGPEIELDYYNFEMLRLPKGHPARDEQDTFYLDYESGLLL
ncbi:MAG: phenylalanine--tRNA ligase subunit alpha, partial [Clostridiaceae bacterium]|nr:phenylalanine--tRNA ligase subunit alpha [Clostridiaceae bacterium]